MKNMQYLHGQRTRRSTIYIFTYTAGFPGDRIFNIPTLFSLEGVSFLLSFFLFLLVSQLCSTLCNSMGCSPPGTSVHGILLARILAWVSIPFSRGSSQPGNRTQVSCIAGGFFTIWAPGKPLEVFGCYLCRSCFSVLGESLLDMPPTVVFLMRRLSSVFYIERGGKGCARERLDNSAAVLG